MKEVLLFWEMYKLQFGIEIGLAAFGQRVDAHDRGVADCFDDVIENHEGIRGPG